MMGEPLGYLNQSVTGLLAVEVNFHVPNFQLNASQITRCHRRYLRCCFTRHDISSLAPVTLGCSP